MGILQLNKLRKCDLNHFINKLFDKNNELTKTKSRYFSNSDHHRQKLAIFQALAGLISCTNHWYNNLISILQTENNQLNITIILECIIGATIPEKDMLNLLKTVNLKKKKKIKKAKFY